MRGHYRDWIAWSLVAAIAVVAGSEFIAHAGARDASHLDAGLRSLHSSADVVVAFAHFWN